MNLREVNARSLITAGVALGAALLVGWWGLGAVYLEPRRELLERIEQGQRLVEQRERDLNEDQRLRREVRELAQRTLGQDPEAAVHTLRHRLNTIGHGVGLTDLRVTTEPVREVRSPASRAFSGRNEHDRMLARQPDFSILSAELNGRGSLDQVVRVMEAISEEPYVKRIDRFSMRPRQGGAEVDLSIGLSTLLLPQAAVGSTVAQGTLPAPDLDGGRAYAMLGSRNVFAPPPPPARQAERPRQPQPDPAPSPPPPVPWGDWTVTGIVRVNDKPELWLRGKNNEVRRLSVGETILEATVVRIETEDAVVKIDDVDYQVEIGQTLGERRWVGQ